MMVWLVVLAAERVWLWHALCLFCGLLVWVLCKGCPNLGMPSKGSTPQVVAASTSLFLRWCLWLRDM